ncbi:hypothetical protein BN12_1650001 [Nostocoides japonicum T1-X7]|uniref:HTH marR-type domain-containing protein n=1 Tax=Nostocoides japonicum T1-X7 TaxID=1194083 RepID=A0A077LWC7_9MICO|nr:MarR family winged helix-turn-helix transcriptional regulator [Tetrasphaera japonica]CCH77112.1 hypothetical protein BN12_1650001 [Tetrasphaera japonica T1-X7]
MPGTAISRGPLLLVYALSRQSGHLLSLCFDGAPLTTEEFAVYSALRIIQPATPSSLAQTVGMKQPTLSNHLRRMEQRRHLRRRAHPHDGRSSILSLTPLGERLTVECFPHFQAAIVPLLDRLGDDSPRILAALEELSGALDDVIAEVSESRRPDHRATGA